MSRIPRPPRLTRIPNEKRNGKPVKRSPPEKKIKPKSLPAHLRANRLAERILAPLATKIDDRFSLRIGITVFGTPSYFDIDEAISEFREFVEQNSKLNLEIVLNKYGPLALDEIRLIPGKGGCSFVNPRYLKPETLEKLPLNVVIQIMIYDIQSTTTCYGGLAYRSSRYTRNVPFTAIPFGNSIRGWAVEPNWKTKSATTLVHEFYHTLTYIFSTIRIELPNPDKAGLFGFTKDNDPGWMRFDKFIYGKITDEMYLALTQEKS